MKRRLCVYALYKSTIDIDIEKSIPCTLLYESYGTQISDAFESHSRVWRNR